MYDLSNKFNTFYRKHVILQKKKKDQLFEKKNLNIKRLREGLTEYNDEHGTDYKLAEDIVQGSVAMSTVTQNEDDDYDIDVAIVFDKHKLPEGRIATKNIVVDALKRKCSGFKNDPEAKTNCVRIVYNDGYHIDFAIYRRFMDENDEYQYEHCGSQWRKRDPKSITQWFLDQNKSKDYNLREVVRLLKMFSKSRNWWKKMPGGLIQSVLTDEQFRSYDRIDERFYYTVKAIKDRLAYNKEVYNPTDPNQSLKLTSEDESKMDNLYKRLDYKLLKLDVLFENKCTPGQALEAWEEFFNHEYWTNQKQEERAGFSKSFSAIMGSGEFPVYKETEEFIDYKFPIDYRYEVNLDCRVTQKGGNKRFLGFLNTILKRKQVLFPGCDLNFNAKTNVPSPFQVYWKVKNQGIFAKQRDCVRGQINLTNKLNHNEETNFKGNHYVECYIVKNGVCVAKQRVYVPIKVS